MRSLLIALSLLLAPIIAGHAQISVSIGINVPSYPRLVQVPGYPVYYDSQADFNYFFYDGEYWVYEDDNWYASSWYNGPWVLVVPEYVPLFVLRVPVRYYRRPPVYFGGWIADAAPRWGDHWGRGWEQHHGGWNRWDRHFVPAPAPLPVYQRQYSGDRYPRAIEQQHSIRAENYRYQPRESVTQQHFQQRGNAERSQNEAHRQSPRQTEQRPTEQAQPRQPPFQRERSEFPAADRNPNTQQGQGRENRDKQDQRPANDQKDNARQDNRAKNRDKQDKDHDDKNDDRGKGDRR